MQLKIKKLIISTVVLLLTSASFASAQLSAADTLKEIAAKVKAARSPEPVVAYVNWNDLFKQMDKRAINELKVTTPTELKSHFTRIFRDPGAYAADIVDKQIAQAPAEQQAAMQDAARTMRSALDKKTQEMKSALGRTEFKIGKSSVNGDNAIVELISLRDGKENVDKVSMKKIGDKWYLTSPNIGSAQSSTGGGSTSGSKAANTF